MLFNQVQYLRVCVKGSNCIHTTYNNCYTVYLKQYLKLSITHKRLMIAFISTSIIFCDGKMAEWLKEICMTVPHGSVMSDIITHLM